MLRQNRRQRAAMPGVFQFQQGTKEFLALFWQRLRENLDDATAVQTAFTSVLLGEDELLDATLAFLHHAPGFRPHIGLETAPTHCANDLPFWRDEHLAFFAHRQRALRRDNRRQRRFVALIQHIDGSFKDIFNHVYALLSQAPLTCCTYYRSLSAQCNCPV